MTKQSVLQAPPCDGLGSARVEWPTVGLLIAFYAVWLMALFLLPAWVAFVVLIPALALHSSLTHEILHGHPFPNQRVNAAIGLLQPGLAIPYLRFRDLHLLHHFDERLTDPYEDPESNYEDPAVYAARSGWMQAICRFNNTLLGRMMIGPALGQWRFMRADFDLIRAGDRRVRLGWLLHVPGSVLVVAFVLASPLSLGAYLCACYGALSVLKIRTFLEHRAFERASGRTVVVEDRGILSFLFLNNNFHVVHHMNPKVAWYELPALYAAGKERFLRRNHGYRYGSYGDVFRRYFLRRKDPVPHPLWPRG